MEFTICVQLYSGLGLTGVGAYWLTDRMFGVLSRIISKYALRAPELELRAKITQSLDRRKRGNSYKIVIVSSTDKSVNYIWESYKSDVSLN